VQEIESVIDEPHFVLAVCGRLRLCEARQSGLVDAAELAIDIGGLHIHVRQGGNHAWIFARPVEPSAGQQLHTAIVDARGHAVTVELDLMQPLRP
jgi:hypothetical protein